LALWLGELYGASCRHGKNVAQQIAGEGRLLRTLRVLHKRPSTQALAN